MITEWSRFVSPCLMLVICEIGCLAGGRCSPAVSAGRAGRQGLLFSFSLQRQRLDPQVPACLVFQSHIFTVG